MPTTFDGNQIKEYIGRVEDHIAEFIGAEIRGARIVGYISQQYQLGDLSADEARELLGDALYMMRLATIGQSYAKQARNPAPEIRIMVLAEEQRKQKAKGQLYA